MSAGMAEVGGNRRESARHVGPHHVVRELHADLILVVVPGLDCDKGVIKLEVFAIRPRTVVADIQSKADPFSTGYLS